MYVPRLPLFVFWFVLYLVSVVGAVEVAVPVLAYHADKSSGQPIHAEYQPPWYKIYIIGLHTKGVTPLCAHNNIMAHLIGQPTGAYDFTGVEILDRCGNDPSAGSPTETLLRLHLPLSVKV